MQSPLKYLRSLGTIGAWIADTAQFITTNWVVTMSAIFTIISGLFDSVILWLQKPYVYTSAGVFLFFLWTFIGLSILRRNSKPILTKGVPDYSYGIIQQGVAEALIGDFPNGHQNAGMKGLSVGLGFCNMSNGPIRLKTEDLRVVINGRTTDDSPNIELIFPKLATKIIRSASVPVDFPSAGTGTITLKVVYGHPDEMPCRRFSLRLRANYNVNDANSSVFTEILEETDEAI